MDESDPDFQYLVHMSDERRNRAFMGAARVAEALGVRWRDVHPDDRVRGAAAVGRLIDGA